MSCLCAVPDSTQKRLEEKVVCVCTCVGWVSGSFTWDLLLTSHMPTLGELCATLSTEARTQRSEEGVLCKAGLIFWIKTPYA